MYISLWERTGNSPLSIEIHILAFHFNNSIVFLNPLQQSPTQVNRRGPLYSGTEGRLPPIFIPAGHHGHSHVTTQPKGGKNITSSIIWGLSIHGLDSVTSLLRETINMLMCSPAKFYPQRKKNGWWMIRKYVTRKKDAQHECMMVLGLATDDRRDI